MAKAKALAAGIIKKKWVRIVAPAMFNNAVVGETYVADPQVLMGRRVTTNLSSLINDMRKQHINVVFQVNSVNKDANSDVIGFYIMDSVLRRFMRKSKSKFDRSFKVRTKDNQIVQIKVSGVTKALASNSKVAALTRALKDQSAREALNSDAKSLIESAVAYKLQKALKDRMNKIAPLKNFEIRYMGIADKPTGEIVSVREYPSEAKAEEVVQEAEIKSEPQEAQEAASEEAEVKAAARKPRNKAAESEETNEEDTETEEETEAAESKEQIQETAQ